MARNIPRSPTRRLPRVLDAPATLSTAGDATLVAPGPGTALRVHFLYAQAKAALGDDAVGVTFTLGSYSHEVELTGSQPWQRRLGRAGDPFGAVWEGELGEELVVTLSGNAPVIVNCNYEEIWP